MLVAKFIRLAFVRLPPSMSLPLSLLSTDLTPHFPPRKKCYRLGNLQTLTQIVHGLQLDAVERLHKTWARVPAWEMRKLRGMQAFVSHLRNVRLRPAGCLSLSLSLTLSRGGGRWGGHDR